MPPSFYASRGTWTIAALLFLLLGSGASALQAQEGSPAAGPPYRVGGDVKRPEKISGAPPVYTELARKARVTGVVILEALIDEQGDVTDLRVIKGLPMGLAEAAVEAVRSWKFKPATLEGQPVPVYYVLTVNFQVETTTSGFGPLFQAYLERHPDFLALLQGKRYQEAADFLDGRARERPDDPEIQLARSYLFLEQGRLAEAWREAQAYRGPEPYEILHRIGAEAWQRTRDMANDPETRAKAVELGLQAETLALEAQDDSFEAVVHKIVLLRGKAKLTSDPEERQAALAEADQLQARARELQQEGKAVGMTLHPAAMEALAGSVDKAFENLMGTRPERISGDFPQIPEKLRRAGVSGVVIVEATIDEQGNVQDARVAKGVHPELDQIALKAVRTWKFKPALRDGKPIKVQYSTTLNFR